MRILQESINCSVENSNENNTSTKKLFNQIAAAVGAYVDSDYPDLYQSNYVSHRGEDVVDQFCDYMINLDSTLLKLLETNIPINMTNEDENNFQNAENCYYCCSELKDDRVRDHDHLTGKFRGAAHDKCNLAARKDKYVPVFFHNLSHYDAHLFIKQLLNKLTTKQKQYFKVLAKNSEDYISFQFGCLRFLDSYRFLNPLRHHRCRPVGSL